MGKLAHTTILFADVSDSTALYEHLGDAAAQQLVGQWLACAGDIIEGRHGEVIHTLGDEVLACFDLADNAAEAARAIQREVERSTEDFGMRIGMHSGMTSRDADGKPFGGVVNLASRMVSLAKRGQILVSEDSFAGLCASMQNRTRSIGSIQIKGKEDPCVVHELLWRDLGASTIQLPVPSMPGGAPGLVITLRGRDQHLYFRPRAYSLGRGKTCDVRVNSRVASRRHATLGFRLGSVVLADQSTNGTYLRTELPQDIFLHREEVVLPVQGLISLGVPIDDEAQNLIGFCVQNGVRE